MLVVLVVEVGGVWGWGSMWGLLVVVLVGVWRARVLLVAVERTLVKDGSKDAQQGTSQTVCQEELIRGEGKDYMYVYV